MSYTFKLACKNNNFFINTYTIPYLLAFRNYQKKISTKMIFFAENNIYKTITKFFIKLCIGH